MRTVDGHRQGVIVGIFRIALGRIDGIGCFGGTSQAFLASLAPLLAFPLVGTAIGLFTEGVIHSLTEFAVYVCALLTPAIVSFELARRWGRGDWWLRFATAFNWCEWILPIAGCAMMIPISIAISAGLDAHVAGVILLGCLGFYGLWLHWFLARHALSLSKTRAVVMVVLVNGATVFVASVPRLITAHLS
jgi:hypothetical protein